MTSDRSQPHGTFLMDFRNNTYMWEKQPEAGPRTPICTVFIVILFEAQGKIGSESSNLVLKNGEDAYLGNSHEPRRFILI